MLLSIFIPLLFTYPFSVSQVILFHSLFDNSSVSVLNRGSWLIVHSLINGTLDVLISPHLSLVGGVFVILLNTKQSVLIPTNSHLGFNCFIFKYNSYISIFALSYIFLCIGNVFSNLGISCLWDN